WGAEGTYVPTELLGSLDPRAATFYIEVSGIKVYGGFPEGGGDMSDRDPWAYPTVLSGDLLGDDSGDGPGLPSKLDNAFHVVRFATDLLNTTELDGFHITDGYGSFNDFDTDGRSGCGIYMAGETYPLISNCDIYDNHTDIGFAFGGGVEVGNNGAPTFSNCYIHENSAERGGGVYCERSFATFNDCVIENNAAPTGAGMRCADASPTDQGTITLNNCFFMNNLGTGLSVADNYTINMTGGEVSGNAGGMYLECAGTVDGVLITFNEATDTSGAGVNLSDSDCTVTIKNCEISFNTLYSGIMGVSGAGISCAGNARPTIVDCQILYNAADPGAGGGGGGGMAVASDCQTTISRGLFVGNEAY
ncbi:MAG: right-handed parallel beta-helix repeat-containing protein, partial [Phycisphaerales bacterium JB038]